jgi:hypothetical protein
VEAIARFRKTGSLGYQAALAELLVHATLRRQGYTVEVHPAGCRLGIDIIKHGANTPSIRKLRGAIEKWAAAQGEGEAGSTPSKTFTIDDWQIDAFLFSGFDKDVIPKRAIAAAGGDLRKISPAAEIREAAAATKGSAYDPLDAPYLLIVADCKEELPGGRQMRSVTRGGSRHDLYTEVKVLETGEQTITDKRKPA